MPNQYGIVAIISVFILLSQTIIDGSLGTALIRRKNPTDIECYTVFYYNITLGVIIYLILYIIAPYIATFFNMPELTLVTRIMALVLIIGGFTSIHQTLFTLNLNFKTMTKIALISSTISGIVGIIMAIKDYQVWALVGQSLSFSASNLILFYAFSKWRPQFQFSWKQFKELWNFSSKIMGSQFIDILYQNIYTIVIGKFFNATTLGYYNRAIAFTTFSSNAPTFILQRVSFPTLCQIQDNPQKLTDTFRSFIKLTAFVTLPLSLGVATIATPMISLLMTDKWIYTAKLLTILCFAFMWYPLHTMTLNILQVCGKAKSFLVAEIIKKVVGVTVLIFTLPFGIEIICYGLVAVSIFSYILSIIYAKRALHISLKSQIFDILPSLIIAFISFTITLFITTSTHSHALSLTLGITSYTLSYIILSSLFNKPLLKSILNKYK